LLTLLLPAIVAPSIARAAPAFADVAAPIAALNDALGTLMKLGAKAPFPQRFQILAPVIDRAFDLTTILANSVGARWAALGDDQRAAVTTAFRRFTIATYVANYVHNDGEKFEITPPLRQQGDDQVVRTQVVPATGAPIRIDYVMRNPWKVVDILLDGTISRVAVQRSDFRALLNQGGIETLITSLHRRVAELSHSTLDPQSAG
jgi:phospholipid transport system substrate-binding protein